MSYSKIEWTDRSWNPVTGCTKISPGCKNCYAERFAERMKYNPKALPKYLNGFEVTMHHNLLREPIRWQKPSRIFVCSMGDLFHDRVPFEFIDKVMATVAHAWWHTFIILTKRPERMLEYFMKAKEDSYRYSPRQQTGTIGIPLNDDRMNVRLSTISGLEIDYRMWPLCNLWLGVSAENQELFDKRVRQLTFIPAAVRFVSFEPLLGPLDIYRELAYGQWDLNQDIKHTQKIHWAICGGETGPGARPMHPSWVHDLLAECQAAGIPFFFKGWGGSVRTDPLISGQAYHEFPKITEPCEVL